MATDLQSPFKQSVPINLPNTDKIHIAIVVSKWNASITENLYNGAIKTLSESGIPHSNITRYNVPGSFELIYGCKIAQQKRVQVVIAIGSVIRGETPHFHYICQSVSLGIKDLNVLGKVPIIFCVLTDDTIKQAKERSGGKLGNKGIEAARAAIEIAQFNDIAQKK